jgi:hypothetical protein
LYQVKDVHVRKDMATGLSRGFGFVTVEAALAEKMTRGIFVPSRAFLIPKGLLKTKGDAPQGAFGKSHWRSGGGVGFTGQAVVGAAGGPADCKRLHAAAFVRRKADKPGLVRRCNGGAGLESLLRKGRFLWFFEHCNGAAQMRRSPPID